MASPRPASLIATVLIATVVVAFVAACGGSSGIPGDPKVEQPVIPTKDGGGNMTKDTGTPDTGPACTPPKYLEVQTRKDGSTLRVGVSGFAHGVPMPDDGKFTLEIFDCDSECRSCRLSGPVMRPDQTDNNRRCANNSAQLCLSNSDCGNSGPCRFFLNPAVEANIGLTVCARLGFSNLDEAVQNGSRMDDSPLQGTVDLTTGDLNFSQFTLKIQQGLCNYCAGGFCENILMGVNKACTPDTVTNGGHGYSYSCPYTPIGEFSIKLAPLRTSNIEWSLSADSPECGVIVDAPGGKLGKKCFCGKCLDGSLCHENGDCPIGSCMELAGTKPNSCVLADSGLINAVIANDAPLPLWFLTSCAENDAAHGVGTCTARGNQLIYGPSTCFSDNGAENKQIHAFGSASPFDDDGAADLTAASLLCMPATTGSDQAKLISAVAGFPGPGLVEVRLHTQLLYE